MKNGEQDIIRLQELIVSSEKQNNKANTLYQKEEQELKNRFVQLNINIEGVLAKIFPQAIDTICSLNSLISRKGKVLYFKNQEVQCLSLVYDSCLKVCEEVLQSFPNTLNSMVAAIKTRANVAHIEEISIKFCREFNTLSVFQISAVSLQSESLSHMKVLLPKVEEDEAPEDIENFSQLITIPIGQSDGREISITFNVQSTDAHAVIAGITGSGKSSLLQSMLLGGAYKYSPDQLQFWILDFKNGTGFIQFKDLKHVRVMCVKNRPIDANEMMDYIFQEYTARTEKIRESGGGDIVSYNKRAKEKNNPLMPRLLIIIDEFVSMPSECFVTLNKLAKVARSVGIGFIFSSQNVDAGYSRYEDAVKQANHLFEFKNKEGDFGKLIRNKTRDEELFVGADVKGRCVYRRSNDRTMFRAAFAGEIEDQVAFVKEINAKWSNYPFDKPIIAGQPERKLFSYNALAVDGQKIKEEFNKTKKVFIPIGEDNLGKPYLYKVNGENPLLITFGNELRVASIELSIIEHFKYLSEAEKAVYYVDLNSKFDRELNVVTAKYGEVRDEDNICYAATVDEANTAIADVYTILKSRMQIDRKKCNDIGNPIELIIHNAEKIADIKADSSPILKIRTPEYAPGSELTDRLKNPSAFKPTEEKEDKISTLDKLCEILKSGKENRIFTMLYFEDASCFDSTIRKLLSNQNRKDFKDVLVVPKIPDEREQLSFSDIKYWLSECCGLREQANSLESNSTQSEAIPLEKNDFICALLIDDKVPHKIIPYEWTME